MVPMTTLIFLFYWACYWPRMIHPAFLFALGLLEDVLSGSVIGLHFVGWQPFSQWLMTIVLYPFLHQINIYLQVYLVHVRPVSGRRL